MIENARKLVVPLVLMNGHIKASLKGILCLWNSMCDTKKGSLLLRTGMSKVKAKNAYVLNSRYIEVQHRTIWHYPGKESVYLRPYTLKESNLVSHKEGSFLLPVYEKSKRKVRKYSAQHTLKYNTTLWYLPAKESRPYIFEESTCPRPHLFIH